MTNSNNLPDKLSSFKRAKAPIDYFKLILLILAAIGVAFLVYISYINTLLFFDGMGLVSPVMLLRKTTLTLEAPREEYQIGEIVNATVRLKTELKKTQGVDVLLRYDPEALTLLTVENQQEDLSKEQGEARLDPLKFLNTQNSPFDIFPYFSINGKKGVINFSALAKPLQQIEGSVEVATLNFQVLKAGDISLDFVFERGKTNDTNVAFYGKDILERVNNLRITAE